MQALLVTNLAARQVSERVKQVIVKALTADLKLEVADTAGRNHATELAREAADRGFELVVAFGGDGTINEVVNGLVGTDTALALLPGGTANVLCRTIGIPVDIVEATGCLLNLLHSGKTRRINVGRIDGRYFALSCGIGLDAETLKRVRENPEAERRYGEWLFAWTALKTAFGEYRTKQPFIRLEGGEVSEDVVLAVVTNAPNLAYFKRWPVKVAPRARLEGGLDVMAMRRFPARYVPRMIWSLFGAGSHVDYKEVVYLHDVTTAHLRSSTEPFPVQVDGEYVGERVELEVELVRDGLAILA